MGKQININSLTENVKNIARENGAALVGVASIDRFDPQPPYYDEPPKGQNPRDFIPNAKSVISISQPILNAVVDAPARFADKEMKRVPPDLKFAYLEMLYDYTGHKVQDWMLLFIGQMVGQFLLSKGYDAMIFPTPGLHPFEDVATGMRVDIGAARNQTEADILLWEGPNKKWAEIYSPFRFTSGPFSHRHAAVRAGLGEFGYNNIVLTKEFGARQRFNSIITDAELVPDPLIDKPICLRDKCLLCFESCIMDAITMRDDPNVQDYRSVQKVYKDIVFIDTPAKTDPTLCRRRRSRIPDSPVRGDCLRVCPLPIKSKNLTKRLEKIIENTGFSFKKSKANEE